MKIVKTIIPAAGLGTRFLPYTKSIAKELLPILNKPALQIVVEEALASQLNNFLIVTRNSKHLSDIFEPDAFLQAALQEKHQEDLLSGINKIIRAAQFSYVHQPYPLGIGHALWLVRHMIEKEYCAVMLPDDIIVNEHPALAQLMRVARQEKASVIAVQEVPEDQLCNYGVVAIKKQITPTLYQVASLVEKPKSHMAPSQLAVVGRYILSHKVFIALEQLSSYASEELQLTDAITAMLHNNERVFAYKIQGERHDIGTPAGWLKANISLGLQHAQYGGDIEQFLIDQGLMRTASDHSEGSYQRPADL